MKILTAIAAFFITLCPPLQRKTNTTEVECQTCTLRLRIAELQAKVEQLELRADFAEVKEVYYKILLETSNYKHKVPSTVALSYASHVVKYAKLYGNDIDDVLSIILAESGYDKKTGYGVFAVSPVGALGAMQIMPSVWRKDKNCGTPDGSDNYFNLETNIKRGNCILAQYRKQFHNSLALAALAYNKGPELVSRELARGIDPSNGYDYKVLRERRRLKRWAVPLTEEQDLAAAVALN